MHSLHISEKTHVEFPRYPLSNRLHVPPSHATQLWKPIVLDPAFGGLAKLRKALAQGYIRGELLNGLVEDRGSLTEFQWDVNSPELTARAQRVACMSVSRKTQLKKHKMINCMKQS